MAQEFLYDKANRVLSKVSPNQDGSKEISIAIIIGILQLLPVLYKCWQDHKKAATRVQNPSFFDRLVLRRAVRQKLGRDTFRKHGGEIMDGILSLGENATEQDIKTFVEEAHGAGG